MNERNILSKTYYDKADIYRVIENEDEDGMTKQTRQKIFENIKCSLSQKRISSITASDTSNMIVNNFTLFLSDEIDIRVSDLVHITNHNKYFKAGTVFKYPNSHSEVSLLENEKV